MLAANIYSSLNVKNYPYPSNGDRSYHSSLKSKNCTYPGANRIKAHQVSFDLKKIPDGTYLLNEYVSCERKNNRIRYIVVTSGKIVKNVDKIEDLIANLPLLEGSEKQVSWAASIRAKFLSDCYRTGVNPPQWVFDQQSAKYWIESRHGLKLFMPEP